MKLGALAIVVVVLTATASASSAHLDRFTKQVLVTDRADGQLVNPWGLAASREGPWWVANEGRSTSTLYSSGGRKQALTVTVPGGPTGVVFNGGPGFVVHANGVSAPARFIYTCEDGMIRGWAPTVPNGWSNQAVVAVDTGASGTVFRGVTLARGKLYATDFHNDRIVVFDSSWRRVVRPGAFVDRSKPEWFAPFGIQAIGDRIFVTYAFRAPVDGNDAPRGGYVDEFDLDGRLLAHVGRADELDEPWGVALAPRGFGRFGGDLLVANFGGGKINAYRRDGDGWTFHGALSVTVDGVWGIAFGTGGMSGPRTTLFYAAGPHEWRGATELNVGGELGSITPPR
ncbi:MAG TPA: TIGR03118 family protein [Acidimicrobiia bacterium]|nr:TIGR03118 family protein [Acidimicrobiia bacterium]